jgi:hypothetical protein
VERGERGERFLDAGDPKARTKPSASVFPSHGQARLCRSDQRANCSAAESVRTSIMQMIIICIPRVKPPLRVSLKEALLFPPRRLSGPTGVPDRTQG